MRKRITTLQKNNQPLVYCYFDLSSALKIKPLMPLSKADFSVKESTLPGSGKGLFTNVDIEKDTLIIEYVGRQTTWKEVKDDADNGYIYFNNRNHVIDARRHRSALARYANDAAGLSRVKGVLNNCTYKVLKGKVYIKAIKNIPAGSEIFVSYGKDYWDTVKQNMAIDKANGK